MRSNLFLVESFGDGATKLEVVGWDAVIKAVAGMLTTREPSPADIAEAKDMLENGHDGYAGWNGNKVVLSFEDGEVAVERLNSVIPSGVAEMEKTNV